MVKRKPLNRSSDMDAALFEALQTEVPVKDTGPDPDDILAGFFDEEEEARDPIGGHSGDSRSVVLQLDELDRERAQQIVDLIRNQTGEQIDLLDAVRIALFVCPLDEQEIHMAHRMIGTRKANIK